jgi:hypothetical protein
MAYCNLAAWPKVNPFIPYLYHPVYYRIENQKRKWGVLVYLCIPFYHFSETTMRKSK